jgi:hypothetical protein
MSEESENDVHVGDTLKLGHNESGFQLLKGDLPAAIVADTWFEMSVIDQDPTFVKWVDGVHVVAEDRQILLEDVPEGTPFVVLFIPEEDTQLDLGLELTLDQDAA